MCFLRFGCGRSHVKIVFLLPAVALISTLARAQQRGPSTPEERARPVQTARLYSPIRSHLTSKKIVNGYSSG